MTLAPLATTADLTNRNITLPSNMDAPTVLQSATDAVRDAAGCAISQQTSTFTLVTTDPFCLDLPFGPVSSVASLVCAGTPVTGWTKVGDTLQIPSGAWPTGTVFPCEVTVTQTYGLPVVPSDIVDLVCQIAAIAGAQDGDPGGSGKITQLRLGDYSETRTYPAGTEGPSPYALPTAVKNSLRARFGSSVSAIKVG